MAQPYETSATDSFQPARHLATTDPKLLRRTMIDAKQADKWRDIRQPQPLQPETKRLATHFGCALLSQPDNA